MIFSASNVTAYMYYDVSPYNYFIKHLIILIGGLVVSCMLIWFNTRSYNKLSWLGVLVIGGSLIGLLLVGEVQNQAKSWYDFGFFSFQPSEFAKIILIIWIASFYDKYSTKKRKKEEEDSNYKKYFPLGVGFGIVALIFLQPDLGTSIILSAIILTMWFSAPIEASAKRKMFIGLFIGAILIVLVLVTNGDALLKERQLARFNYFDPCDKLLTTGNQVCNGYIAINNGGLTGVGLGSSTQKYLYLPEPYTDFILAIIMEETGLIITLIIFLLYLVLLYRILLIGKRSYSDKGALLCYGVAFYIFFHIIVNVGGIFGMLPLTGVPLPFMSYGGSFAICLIVGLTAVQRVAVETRLTDRKRRK